MLAAGGLIHGRAVIDQLGQTASRPTPSTLLRAGSCKKRKSGHPQSEEMTRKSLRWAIR